MSKRLDNHNESFSLLHDTQLTLDCDIKMIMTKIGITPVNASPPSPPLQQRNIDFETPTNANRGSWIEAEGFDFDMTPADFDRAMEDYTWAQGERPVQKFPPVKKGRGNV